MKKISVSQNKNVGEKSSTVLHPSSLLSHLRQRWIFISTSASMCGYVVTGFGPRI